MFDTDICPMGQEEPFEGCATCKCGKFFERKSKRGRMPNSCDWYKEQEKKALDKERAERAALRAKSSAQGSGTRAIPKLEPAGLDLEVGDRVYYKSNAFSGWKQAAYAKDYLVTEINGDEVWVVRNQKTGFKQVPVKTFVNALYVRTGVEYIEVEDEGPEFEVDDDE